MSQLKLQLRQPPPFHARIDLRGVIPNRLRTLSIADIERLEIRVDDQRSVLGDWFDVSGIADSPTMVYSGTLDCCDGVGAGMDGGTLIVESSVGDNLGWGMKAGQLLVEGSAGRFCGRQLRGGEVCIAGDVGDFAGGADSTETQGMRGGTLLVRGGAGRWAAHRMRRGRMIVHGPVQSGLASRMIAGTVICCSTVQPWIGCGMRRGTVLLFDMSHLKDPHGSGGEPQTAEKSKNDCSPLQSAAPSFTQPDESELSYLPILIRSIHSLLPEHLKSLLPTRTDQLPRRGLRCLGDRTYGSLGELIQLGL